jgi:SAM-dependent methyltransferase
MTSTSAIEPAVEVRARLSRGTSDRSIYQSVSRALVEQHAGGVLVDVGCGGGNLWPYVRPRFDRYVGADVVRYDAFPADGEFCQVDLDACRVPLPDHVGDVVAAVETIEHVENPRALMRELVRLTKPGGLVVVTTPNQLSFLSKLTLVVKNQFNAFQAACYPAHITALLEIDLLRMACECGLTETRTWFSEVGRVPGTAAHYPGWLARLRPRLFSDTVLMAARRPAAPAGAPG